FVKKNAVFAAVYGIFFRYVYFFKGCIPAGGSASCTSGLRSLHERRGDANILRLPGVRGAVAEGD
ncbi:MAG: hypothetical protein J6A48_07580, partial [Clostridia bacterium]|nr:hypothetical protein [Clostridia bacterium]